VPLLAETAKIQCPHTPFTKGYASGSIRWNAAEMVMNVVQVERTKKTARARSWLSESKIARPYDSPDPSIYVGEIDNLYTVSENLDPP